MYFKMHPNQMLLLVLTLCSVCVCGTFSLYINRPELENPTMTATTGELPSGDGNCECGDGKYTLKIKPLKVRYDSICPGDKLKCTSNTRQQLSVVGK